MATIDGIDENQALELAATVESDSERYNVFEILLAAGVLAPIGILLSPAVGALLVSLRTVIVVINAQFLRQGDLDIPSLPVA